MIVISYVTINIVDICKIRNTKVEATASRFPPPPRAHMRATLIMHGYLIVMMHGMASRHALVHACNSTIYYTLVNVYVKPETCFAYASCM